MKWDAYIIKLNLYLPSNRTPSKIMTARDPNHELWTTRLPPIHLET